MAKTSSWSMEAEEMRRLFTLTYDDLHFLEPLRADAQRLYRALVLVWARVERVLVGLNKGETLHSMARDIAFGHQGRFTDRSYEAQLNRASALSLVINAIVVWNTRHFERARTKLSEQGEEIEDSVWQHLSPLVWKHINLVGSYHFTDAHLEEEFRPLREVEGRRARRESSAAPSRGVPRVEENALFSKEQRGDEEELPVQLLLLQDHED